MESSLQSGEDRTVDRGEYVAILVLVESSLQYVLRNSFVNQYGGRNPCFSGIFFAIKLMRQYQNYAIESQSLF